MKKTIILILIFVSICFTEKSQARTVETIFTLSDDTHTATKYFSCRSDNVGNSSFVFDENYNRNSITYARPENYKWIKYYSDIDKKNYIKIEFADTASYAFLERVTNKDTEFFWKDKNEEKIYILYVNGSECVGEGCLQDESIISTIIPNRFKVIDYFAIVNGKRLASGEGNWKIVDNTYTFYRFNLKGANTAFILEESSNYGYDKLNEAFKSNKNISVSNEGNRIRVVLPVENLFASGSADMQKKGLEWLSVIKKTLADMNFIEIRVEGHTDNIPVNGKTKSGYTSNWDLSAARSANIVKHLISQGVSSEKIAAVGYADAHPIATNDTVEGRAKNRRIEFSIITSDVNKNLSLKD